MEMEASPAPTSSLRRRLRATVCCCFGYGGRARWGGRDSRGVGRYDPLSYALNFDEGPDDSDDDVDYDDFSDGGLLYRSFPSPPPPLPQPTRERTSSIPPPRPAVAAA
ncbi:uncharacterized protein [Aegilops tauschii subsp. strangulata]|uniref:Uncharacterized protein n=1 Tax=Aegilops tauschii TaxID=37682 RepID=N1QUV7_AEGTA|nr:uncharacterized protein LOC109781672 [Aegilops tauschii subsp. strangulata]